MTGDSVFFGESIFYLVVVECNWRISSSYSVCLFFVHFFDYFFNCDLALVTKFFQLEGVVPVVAK